MDPSTDARINMNEMGRRGVPFIFVIDFELEHPLVLPAGEAILHGIFFRFPLHSNCFETKPLPERFPFLKSPVNYNEYHKAFRVVFDHILQGDSYLVNLTFPTPVKAGLTLKEIFLSGNVKYSLLVRDKFVVFSPESFVHIFNGMIHSYPMKGTIDASLENAEAELLNNPKELAEHNTIVDLIRNDLSMVSKEVRVNRFRYLEKITTNYKNLLQTSSEITGKLDDDYPGKIGDIIFSLLPAGSVSGAPKKRTMEIIREAESLPRGYYTGVCGYFDGKDLESAVMIRFIEKTTAGMVFRSGGGITCFSDPWSEYCEMVDKVYVPVA